MGQVVYRLGGGVDDVHQAFVDAHLELFPAFFINVRAFDDSVNGPLGRQRHGAVDGRAGPERRVDDLFGGLVYHLVVVGFQPDPDFLGIGGLGAHLSVKLS